MNILDVTRIVTRESTSNRPVAEWLDAVTSQSADITGALAGYDLSQDVVVRARLHAFRNAVVSFQVHRGLVEWALVSTGRGGGARI